MNNVVSVPSQKLDFGRNISWSVFVFNVLRRETIVRFVDHHCLYFLFIIRLQQGYKGTRHKQIHANANSYDVRTCREVLYLSITSIVSILQYPTIGCIAQIDRITRTCTNTLCCDCRYEQILMAIQAFLDGKHSKQRNILRHKSITNIHRPCPC